jgi:hypothetical protein
MLLFFVVFLIIKKDCSFCIFMFNCICILFIYIYIYILFGYYPFTTGATTIGVTVVASLKLCTMQYKNIIDTLISTIIVNKSYCLLY